MSTDDDIPEEICEDDIEDSPRERPMVKLFIGLRAQRLTPCVIYVRMMKNVERLMSLSGCQNCYDTS